MRIQAALLTQACSLIPFPFLWKALGVIYVTSPLSWVISVFESFSVSPSSLGVGVEHCNSPLSGGLAIVRNSFLSHSSFLIEPAKEGWCRGNG